MAKWQNFKACIFSPAPVLLKAKVCIVKSHQWNKQVSFAAVTQGNGTLSSFLKSHKQQCS